MRYERQAIIVLASDLKSHAALLQAKRELAGDHAKSSIHRGSATGPLDPPLQPLPPNSRLIIIAHGDENTAKCIHIDGGVWTGSDLAKALQRWFTPGQPRISRISLDVCRGGGIQGNGGFAVHPNASFGYELAKCCGFAARSVTARTDFSTVAFIEQSGPKQNTKPVLFGAPGKEELVHVSRVWKGVGNSKDDASNKGPWAKPGVPRKNDEMERKEGDKVVFETAVDSSPETAAEPTIKQLLNQVYS
jgi:hypothetical protein